MARQSLLGLKELVAIGVGGMIGGGIFSVMGLAVGITGNASPIAFLLGGILLLATITTLILYLWAHLYSSLRWIISIYTGNSFKLAR